MRRALLAVVVLLMSACLGSDFAESLQGTWQLVSGTVGGEEIPVLDSHPITLTFEGDRVGGTASCNGYGGTFSLSGSTVGFGDLAMTEMACASPETMEAETLYARALTLVNTLTIDQTLTLSGPDVTMSFDHLEPVPDAELIATVWVLESLIDGDSVSSVSPGRATVEFFTDGSTLGGTGCRLLSGHYVVNGAELVVTDLAAEGPDCDPDLARQDDMVISVLETPMRVEIVDRRLTLTAPGGDGLAYLADAE